MSVEIYAAIIYIIIYAAIRRWIALSHVVLNHVVSILIIVQAALWSHEQVTSFDMRGSRCRSYDFLAAIVHLDITVIHKGDYSWGRAMILNVWIASQILILQLRRIFILIRHNGINCGCCSPAFGFSFLCIVDFLGWGQGWGEGKRWGWDFTCVDATGSIEVFLAGGFQLLVVRHRAQIAKIISTICGCLICNWPTILTIPSFCPTLITAILKHWIRYRGFHSMATFADTISKSQTSIATILELRLIFYLDIATTTLPSLVLSGTLLLISSCFRQKWAFGLLMHLLEGLWWHQCRICLICNSTRRLLDCDLV